MKTNRQFFLWFAVVVMFCAAVSLGCGGSSSSDNTESTDESTGRNQGGWEDLAFDEFAGAWEIASITAGMGNNITFDTPTLGVARCKFTTDSENNTITLATLDGRVGEYLRCNFSDSQGHTLNQAVILSGGTYSSTSLSNVYRQDINDAHGSYRYLLQGLDANRGKSFPYKYLYFYNTYTAQDNPDNSYVIQTVLQKIPMTRWKMSVWLREAGILFLRLCRYGMSARNIF